MSLRSTILSLIMSALLVPPQLTIGAQLSKPTSEGQAFISPTEARLVFPRDSARSFLWDVPVKGAYAGGAEFMWEVSWPDQYIRDGEDPLGLWLTTRWKPGGPHKGTLAQLVAGHTVDPMINCTTCDMAVYTDPERDSTKVFATVEGGRLVFNIRGREAVHRIFPSIPDTVTFSKTVRQTPLRDYGPGDTEESQTVLVNCRNTSAGGRRRSCVVVPKVQMRLPDADSAAAENAPRQVYVVVLRFSDAELVRNIDVTIKKPSGKVWAVMSTGSLGAFSMRQPPLGPILLVARCPRGSLTRTFISGTLFLNVRPSFDSTVHLMTDQRPCLPPVPATDPRR
jgi:hypothetical protein